MPRQLLQLFGWHLAFCVFYYPVQDLLKNRQSASVVDILYPPDLALMLAGFLVLFGYTIAVYLALRRAYDRPWYELVGWLVVASVAGVGFRYLAEEVIAPVLIGFRNYPAGTSLLTYYLDNLYYLVLHGTVGAVVYLLQTTKLRERQRQELLVENQRTELAFLRAQINPHFLFNTLNNVYSLFYQQSDKALNVIERLTTMLRYGLYEKAERVPLARETEHLRNFIELEKLRLGFEPDLRMELPEPAPPLLVPPLLLITFVENAFKHGDLRQPTLIRLRITEGKLEYLVSNAVGRKQRDGTGGIGLENLRKRLELMYPGRHSLKVGQEGNDFAAVLTIDGLVEV